MVTNYTGTGIAEPEGIAAGPDGALWFTNFAGDSIGRISTAGVVTNYTGPGISKPRRSRRSRRRRVFTNLHNSIGGSAPPAWSPTTPAPHPQACWNAAGPDGAVWFTNFFDDSIGRISTAGLSPTTPALASTIRGDHGNSNQNLNVTCAMGSDGRRLTECCPMRYALLGERPCGSPYLEHARRPVVPTSGPSVESNGVVVLARRLSGEEVGSCAIY